MRGKIVSWSIVAGIFLSGILVGRMSEMNTAEAGHWRKCPPCECKTCPPPSWFVETPECEGQTCGGDSCLVNVGASCPSTSGGGKCATTSTGEGACFNLTLSCNRFESCDAHGNCDNDAVCLVDTCCGRPVCVTESDICVPE